MHTQHIMWQRAHKLVCSDLWWFGAKGKRSPPRARSLDDVCLCTIWRRKKNYKIFPQLLHNLLLQCSPHTPCSGAHGLGGRRLELFLPPTQAPVWGLCGPPYGGEGGGRCWITFNLGVGSFGPPHPLPTPSASNHFCAQFLPSRKWGFKSCNENVLLASCLFKNFSLPLHFLQNLTFLHCAKFIKSLLCKLSKWHFGTKCKEDDIPPQSKVFNEPAFLWKWRQNSLMHIFATCQAFDFLGTNHSFVFLSNWFCETIHSFFCTLSYVILCAVFFNFVKQIIHLCFELSWNYSFICKLCCNMPYFLWQLFTCCLQAMSVEKLIWKSKNSWQLLTYLCNFKDTDIVGVWAIFFDLRMT